MINSRSAGTWSGHYCGNYQERGWGGSLPVWDDQGFLCYGSYQNSWFNETTRQVEATAAYTQYRYRDGNYTYYYEKWSDWTEWSETAKTADTNTQVEQRTRYKYRKK